MRGWAPAPEPEAGADTLRALYEVALAAARTGGPALVASVAVEHAQRLLRCDGAVVFVWDDESGLLQPLRETSSAVPEPPLKPGEGAIGRAFVSGEPVIIDDYQRWDSAVAESASRGMASALAVPLMIEDQPAGALGVWTYEARRFSEEDVRLLSLFASHITPELEAARRNAEIEARARIFQALHEVSTAAGAGLHPKELAQLSVSRARALLEIDGSDFYWFDESDGLLHLLASADSRRGHRPEAVLAPGTGVTGAAFAEGRPVVVDDYQAWGRSVERQRHKGVASAIAVPLVTNDRSRGALAVWSYKQRHFDTEEVQLLALFAGQVAPAIEAAGLLEARALQAQTFLVLYELAVAASGVLEPDVLARQAVEAVVELLGAGDASLFHAEPESGALRLLAAHGAAAAEQPDRAVTRVIRDCEPSSRLTRDGAVLTMPLVTGDRAIGALRIHRRKRERFTESQRELASLLASLVTPALQAARLAAERHAQAHTFRLLHDLAVAASGVLEPEVIARRAADYARELTGMHDALLAVWDEEQRRLRVLADTDPDSPELPMRGKGVMGSAFEREAAMVVEDYQAWPNAWEGAHERGIKTVAAVPLMSGDRAVGVLAVRSYEITAFPKEKVQLLGLIAGQVAPALEAARLHASLSASETRFRSLYETMASGVLLQDPDGVVLDANSAAEEVVGLPLSRMRGRKSTELWRLYTEGGAEQDRDDRPAIRAVQSGRPVRDFTAQLERLDGSRRWVRVDSVPLAGVAGTAGLVVSSLLDITASRRAEEALRESEQRFRAIFDRAAMGIARLDLSAHVIEANPALSQMLGYEAGALVGRDVGTFMVPDDRDPELFARLARGEMDSFQLEVRFLSREGSMVWANAIASLVRDAAGRPSFVVAMVEDISMRKGQEAALAHQALHDSLTDLPNRVLLHDRLHQAIRIAERGQERAALLLMDLDGFKEINDTFGHHCGDALLSQVAARLRDALRISDTVARLGGDEFAIVLPKVEEAASTAQAARKVLAALETPFTVEGQRVHVGGSIGIALFPDHGEDADTLMRRADVAMYVAKRSGGGFSLYAPEEDVHSPSRLSLATALRDAVQSGDLVLHYQPKVRLSDGAVVGLEALVRWIHPQLGMVQPDQFIPLAEQTGLIRPLGAWVLGAAIEQGARWLDEGISTRVAVNISARQLRDPQLAEVLETMLAEHELPPAALMLEITESALMDDPERSIDMLERLGRTGVKLSIDDFGTGYSSLAYLRRLPAAELKIDRSFVSDLVRNDSDAVIVRSTIDLGHNLGMEVVAEGVENPDTRQLLTQYGCDFGQGYLFSPALPPSDAALRVRRGIAAAAPD